MKESRKEFIREAHAAACPEWKQKIESEFPKLFQAEIKVGDWVIYEILERGPARVDTIKGSMAYGFFKGHQRPSAWVYKHNLRKATPKEIEEHLIAEAKRRGFVNGVRFKGLGGTRPYYTGLRAPLMYRYEIDKIKDQSLAIIYENGQWAEIIESTPEDIPGFEGVIELLDDAITKLKSL